MDDYYGRDANLRYFSVSQIKSFLGCPAKHGCEARAVAELYGEYEQPHSDALVIGSYIDVMLTGTDEEQAAFIETHPEMFSTHGPTKDELKAQYKQASLMVSRVFKDAADGGIFRKTLEGEQQKIFTGEIHGYLFKAKLDVLGRDYITDLKTTESITKRYYSNGWYNFIDYWNYPFQGAVYQELVAQNTGRRLPFYIAAISKETSPDLGVFQIPQDALDAALEAVTPEMLERISLLKQRAAAPVRCEHCDYCRSTKIVKQPINYYELEG